MGYCKSNIRIFDSESDGGPNQANIYSNGLSEEIIGQALKEYRLPRESLVLMSKCFFGVDHSGAQRFIPDMSFNMGDHVNQVGLSRKYILASIESSVKRLGTYIDVLHVHRLDRQSPLDEVVRALDDARNRGLIHYVTGSSVMSATLYSCRP